MSELFIREATPDDAAAICAIYNPYIEYTTISFEEKPVAVSEMAERIAHTQAQGLPWLVAEAGGDMLGYAYATRWRVRPAYRHAVESSIYMRQATVGQGVGKLLYRELIRRLAVLGLHTVIGGVAQPNPASDGLHRALGFKQVAQFEQVGRKFGRWLDVAYWQLPLTRDLAEASCN
ncbi:GNAT family N-acetyltransferase [Vogesella sp. DC21W]|uniref:GNAT family N-acetyltransferase n=1 Tax=Vogesella aquatica TaxID=2984206 RepID=A0ABT5ITA0_9NEIS|nr:arsinothricin resistance N-acetyltransferase ArsN1 family B [Vogesella aquatica]MDC7715793.1 GNAT family N-acetyltransferase [Vogesella aquatica]